MSYNPDYHYWQYFLSLEKDLINLSRYIDFKDANQPASINAQVYSIELARIFLTACAECENIGKLITSRRHRNLPDISVDMIQQSKPEYAKIPSQQIFCPTYDLTFTPWAAWSLPKIEVHEFQRVNRPYVHYIRRSKQVFPTPDWWKAHNDVKHDRTVNYTQANLFNTLNAVAGLMCLLFNKMQTVPSVTNSQYTVIIPRLLAPQLFIPKYFSPLINDKGDFVWAEN